MRYYAFIFIVAVAMSTQAGELADPIQKALSERDAAVEKATQAANAKLITELRAAAKRPGVDKSTAYSELLKLVPDDAEAKAALEKDGKLAEPAKDPAISESEMGKAVYKVWSNKSKLDLDETGLMEVVEGGKYTKHPKMQDQFVQITTVLVIPENGEYKAAVAATKAKVTLNGKVVDWSKPTIIALPKGRYPLVAEFETFPKSFSLQFGKKSDASIEPLKAPYMETDLNALKEWKRNKKP